MEESTTLCTNCQRPIAASNFVTHNLHCQRNLIKCEKCGETVPRSGMEEHDLEFHVQVKCPDCHLMLEKPQLDTHKKTACRSRPQGCRYCELELPAAELHEHENYCGSRTKKCEDCGEYVMLKYEQLHLDSNHTFLKLDDEPGPTATWIKNDIDSGSLRSIKANNNKKPQLSTGKFENVDDSDDELYKMLGNLMKNNRPVGTTSHYPGVAYPVSGGTQRTVARSPPPYQVTPNESPDLVALPCEFCEAMIPVNQLLLHQTGCRPDITSEARIKYPTKEFQKRNMKSSLYDEEDLPLDIEDKNNSLETNPGTKLFEDKNERRNRDKVLLHNSGSLRRNAIDRGNEVSVRNDADDDGIILPCEFCGDGYPPSLLLEHQDVCDYCPRNVPDMSPLWTGSQDTTVEKLDGRMKADAGRTWKFEDSSHNTYVDAEQTYTNRSRGKSNISNSYNDLHGNFSVASEWSDDGGSRPTSATGAIPKQKAGKLNTTRKVNQEVQSSRPSSSVSASHTRVAPDSGIISSGSDFSPRFQIRNNLKDCDDDDES